MNLNIIFSTRIEIMNTIVHSRLTYSYQAWTMTKDKLIMMLINASLDGKERLHVKTWDIFVWFVKWRHTARQHRKYSQVCQLTRAISWLMWFEEGTTEWQNVSFLMMIAGKNWTFKTPYTFNKRVSVQERALSNEILLNVSDVVFRWSR